jgi:hypothetical protein
MKRNAPNIANRRAHTKRKTLPKTERAESWLCLAFLSSKHNPTNPKKPKSWKKTYVTFIIDPKLRNNSGARIALF